jgi:hypothetical protein
MSDDLKTLATASGVHSSIPWALPDAVRKAVADLAKVPPENRDEFYDVIQLPIRLIWETDRRANGIAAGKALNKAAKAAREFAQAVNHMSEEDHEWVKQLWTKAPLYRRAIPHLEGTASALAQLFSLAVGKAPLQDWSGTPRGRGRRPGDIKNLAFQEFVHHLVLVTEEWSGGQLTFDKNYKERSTLLKAIKILGDFLPPGVVPTHLPLSTIQRIKTDPGRYTGLPDIDFFRPK